MRFFFYVVFVIFAQMESRFLNENLKKHKMDNIETIFKFEVECMTCEGACGCISQTHSSICILYNQWDI